MFGKWIKTERERQGWSQSELARRAGITSQAVNQLEHGKIRNPNRETAEGLARVFRLTVDEMYRLAYGEQPTVDELRSEGVLPSEWLDELATLEDRLTPGDRAALIRQARALAAFTDRITHKGEHQPSQQPDVDSDAGEPSQGQTSARGLNRMHA